MALRILTSYSLNSDELASQIQEKTANQRYLHLCATRNIKDVRTAHPLFSASIPYKKGGHDFSLAAFLEFHDFLRQDVFRNKKTIRLSDERYILLKTIQYMFKDDPKYLKIFIEMRFQLHELFSFLLFHHTVLSEEAVVQIGVAYSDFEKNIFALYRIYAELLEDITANKSSEKTSLILGQDIATGINGLDTVHNQVKAAVTAYIENIDVLILDGFLFFDDLQRYMLTQAIKLEKEVYLTAKDSGEGCFLFDTVYPDLFAELKQEIKIPAPLASKEEPQTALRYVQKNYGKTPDETAAPMLDDGSISFVTPFPNREMEWRYIAGQISLLLYEKGGQDIDKLKALLKSP